MIERLDVIIKRLIKERRKFSKIYNDESKCLMHDSNMRYGYKISKEQMEKDLKILRQIKKQFLTNY